MNKEITIKLSEPQVKKIKDLIKSKEYVNKKEIKPYFNFLDEPISFIAGYLFYRIDVETLGNLTSCVLVKHRNKIKHIEIQLKEYYKMIKYQNKEKLNCSMF